MKQISNTILLVPGLWMAPVSWKFFREHYLLRGYNVVTPPWPGVPEDSTFAFSAPSRSANHSVDEVVVYYENLIRCLDEEPLMIGHGIGGLIVQLLLNRGRGTAGIAVASVPPHGIFRVSWGMLEVCGTLLANPLNFLRTVTLPFNRFRDTFANTMTDEEARAAYRDYVVPGPGRTLFDLSVGNLVPGGSNRVKREADQRAPLLFVAGAKDRLVPPSIIRANYAWYRSKRAFTAYKEFPGRSHLIFGQTGWEEVADYCLSWAKAVTADESSMVPAAHAEKSQHQQP